MKQGWVTDQHGTKNHYVDNVLHNDDGPAIIRTNGAKLWYKNGQQHRVDGPAIEYSNGQKMWYYLGNQLGGSWYGYTNETFKQFLKFKAFM